MIKTKKYIEDLKGVNQLVQEGVLGVVDVVDSMHQNVLNLGGVLNESQKTKGLTGFIYRSIRASTRISYQAINFALSNFTPVLPDFSVVKQRNHWVSMLNGVMGDHLAVTDNPLALDMSLWYEGQEITLQQAAIIWSNPDVKPLLLIHGLCMPASGWQRKNHDHGHALAATGSYSVVYLNYNSGLAIVDNGEKLSQLLAQMSQLLPEAQKLNVLAYSMGGLVIRAALQMAAQNQDDWPQQIDKLVFLGVPHNGALLEKTGHLLDYLMKISPFSAPIAQMSQTRSQGIKDLRQGRISDNDEDDKRTPLPPHIKTYAIAATLQEDDEAPHKKILGDGLVTVNSALGRHKLKRRSVGIKKNHQITVPNVTHLGLLSDKVVFSKLVTIFS